MENEQKEIIETAKGLPPNGDGFNLRPRSFEEAYRFANMMAQSDLVPKDFRGKPENVMLAIQLGSEVGLHPMQAIQSIAVINGRPSMWGDAVLGLVQSSGLLEHIEETVKDGVATCTMKRKGMSPTVRTFSKEDAKKAGLLGKQGPWQNYENRMLQLRARGFCIRDAFADVLKGLWVREEVEDMTPVELPEREELAPPERLSEQKPAEPENPQDEKNAPEFTLSPEDA